MPGNAAGNVQRISANTVGNLVESAAHRLAQTQKNQRDEDEKRSRNQFNGNHDLRGVFGPILGAEENLLRRTLRANINRNRIVVFI